MNKIFLPLLALVLGSGQLHAQPVITSQPVNQTMVWGGNATFSVMATDVGPLTYQWQLNGTNLPNNIITTVAGGQLFNNLPATNLTLNGPEGATVDSAGNLYIADYFNNVVRRMDTNGLMTIVAGNGSASFSGDGGQATNAGLVSPAAAVVDANGNLFIADSGNQRIRKVDMNGVITTYAGTGSAAFSGDNGQATNAALNRPSGLATDASGNLFIADTSNSRIRKVSVSGVISTVAGSSLAGYNGDNISPATSARLNFPNGVAVDATGNIYIADTSNYRVRKVNTSSTITTIAGTGIHGFSNGGSATTSQIGSVEGVAVDSNGNVFIADSDNNCIRKITNNIITTVVGTNVSGFFGDGGVATNAALAYPYAVAVDPAGNLYVADTSNNRIRKAGTNGIITTVAGTNQSNGVPATDVNLNSPWGVACDKSGNFYIADRNSSQIHKVDTNGVISTFAGNGIPVFAGDGGSATNASLLRPIGIALDAAGNVYIADSGNYRVRKVDTNGIMTTIAGTGSGLTSGDGGPATNSSVAPQGVTVDAFGNVLIADNARIRKIDTNGILTTVAGNGSFSYSGDGGMATNAGIGVPAALTLDSTGNLYFGSGFNSRIRKVNTSGIISTVAGNGTSGFSGDGNQATNANISTVYGLSVDSGANLLISDSFNDRIRKVGTDGIITTMVGNGVRGFFGDGSSAYNANLSLPRGICLDTSANLLITDTGNNRVRKLSYVDFADQPSFTLTNVTPDSLGNNYSVIITSASGSVTSSVVTVNLQLPPITPAFTASNSVCTFTWSTVSNQTYQLQSATNLVAPNWIDLGSPITATNNSVSATNAVGSDGQRFYRVRLWP